MKKLLRKLFFWLFKEDFERMNKLESDLKGLIHRQKSATQEAEVHAARIKQLMGNIDVSVDVHHRSGSWAVVSLQGGKTGSRDMMDIAHFLRQYDRANVKIDASPFDRHMINEEIFRI